MTQPRNWRICELQPIKTRPGSIQLPSDPQAESDKRAKLIGKSPAHLKARSVK